MQTGMCCMRNMWKCYILSIKQILVNTDHKKPQVYCYMRNYCSFDVDSVYLLLCCFVS